MRDESLVAQELTTVRGEVASLRSSRDEMSENAQVSRIKFRQEYQASESSQADAIRALRDTIRGMNTGQDMSEMMEHSKRVATEESRTVERNAMARMSSEFDEVYDGLVDQLAREEGECWKLLAENEQLIKAKGKPDEATVRLREELTEDRRKVSDIERSARERMNDLDRIMVFMKTEVAESKAAAAKARDEQEAECCHGG